MSDLPSSDSHERSDTVATRSVSHRWLLAAVVATLACSAIALAVLMGLRETGPAGAEPSTAQLSEPDGSELSIAVARTPGGPGEWTNWARVIKYLSEELDRPVSVRYLSKEDAAAEIIVRDRIDIAFVCAHQYVDMEDHDQAVGVVTPVIHGSTTNRMMLVVAADDDARGLGDLGGSIVAVSDKSSLGGYSYLSYLCQQQGVDPTGYFAELRLGDSQEQNMHDVLVRDARATIVSSAQVVSWDMSRFRIVEESEPLGIPPLIARADLDPELIQRIADILVAMDVDTVIGVETAIDGFERLDPVDYEFARVLRGACGHHDHD